MFSEYKAEVDRLKADVLIWKANCYSLVSENTNLRKAGDELERILTSKIASYEVSHASNAWCQILKTPNQMPNNPRHTPDRPQDQYNGIIDTQLKVIEELRAEVESLMTNPTGRLLRASREEVKRLRKAGNAIADIIKPPAHGFGEHDSEWLDWQNAKAKTP